PARSMRSCDVLIVGGGPAGSTAAWKLRRAGADVLVLDREPFPRLKLCAGWITPEVVRDLDMDLASYPHRLLTFPRLRLHWGRLHVPVPCVQHSIRRFEFDAWLLERSGAPLEQHNVRRIERDGNDFRQHWAHLAAMLGARLAPGAHYDPSGYSYYLRGRVDVVRRDNAFITGDAAGLATRDLGEGIGPAIRSGLRAAQAIVAGEPYRLEDVSGASVSSIARSMLGRATRASVFSGRRQRTPGGGPAH